MSGVQGRMACIEHKNSLVLQLRALAKQPQCAKCQGYKVQALDANLDTRTTQGAQAGQGLDGKH